MVFLFVLFAQSCVNKPAVASSTDLEPFGRSVGETNTADGDGEQVGVTLARSYEDIGVWAVEDFEHIQIGVSTKEELLQIAPRKTVYQRGRGEILQFALEDGRTMEFVCKNGIVSEISFRG